MFKIRYWPAGKTFFLALTGIFLTSLTAQKQRSLPSLSYILTMTVVSTPSERYSNTVLTFSKGGPSLLWAAYQIPEALPLPDLTARAIIDTVLWLSGVIALGVSSWEAKKSSVEAENKACLIFDSAFVVLGLVELIIIWGERRKETAKADDIERVFVVGEPVGRGRQPDVGTTHAGPRSRRFALGGVGAWKGEGSDGRGTSSMSAPPGSTSRPAEGRNRSRRAGRAGEEREDWDGRPVAPQPNRAEILDLTWDEEGIPWAINNTS
jgi:hypothetical protein